MKKLLASILLLTPLCALSDIFEPSHNCRKPYKPISFSSQWEVDSFMDDVDRYRECIQDFVEEQNKAIKNHSRAADRAIDDWNHFVRFELN